MRATRSLTLKSDNLTDLSSALIDSARYRTSPWQGGNSAANR
jgi:hypothetical protein